MSQYRSALKTIARYEKKLVVAARREADRARKFPENTCPASRHLYIMADCMTKKGGYPMLTEEPAHCAQSIFAVVAALWDARTELSRLRGKPYFDPIDVDALLRNVPK